MAGIPGARGEPAVNIESQIRLSQWLEMVHPSSASEFTSSYLQGLVWMVPEEAQEQGRIKLLLLESLRDGRAVPGVSRIDAAALADFVESLPVTGRVVVERADSRWLEVNPVHDPLLHPGQRIWIPGRPLTVTVVRGDGHLCQAVHSVRAFALDYVRQCDPASRPGTAWIVQPDGLVQRRKIADWNEQEQDPPAPGAWIVTDDPAIPWPEPILEQVARLLATQGVSPDRGEAVLAPEPRQFNSLSGRLDAPRNLRLTASDWGTVGVLQTPTARMNPAGSASIGFSHTTPYTWMNGDLQPFDWLEVSLRWIDASNHLYGPTFAGGQTYKDKSIDVKLKVLDETPLLPQLAVGLRDIGGTGLFAGEYLVGSKRTGDLDWSLGLGWGYLGGRGNLANPFSVINRNMNTRQIQNAAQGGQVNIASMFTGRTSLFGGVQYQTPWDDLLLKLEYDGNNYQHEPFGSRLKQKTPLNAGLVYRYSPAVDLSLGVERGTTINFGFNYHGDLSKLSMPKLFDPQPEKVTPEYPSIEPDWNYVAKLLEEKTSWHVLQIRRAGSEVIVRFENASAFYWNGYMDRIASVLHRHVPGKGVLVFRIQSEDYGLDMHEFLIDRQAWVAGKTDYVPVHRKRGAVSEQPEYDGFIYPVSSTLVDNAPQKFDVSVGPTYKQILGGPDGFVLFQAGIGATGNWHFSPDTWWTGSLEGGLIDNFNKFKYTAPSNLQRVRTYSREYVTSSRVTMPLFQLTHVGKLDSENFYSVYGGMLESMYGGVGGEWLYRPWQSSLAFGVDINAVKQRGFKQDFSLLNPKYSIVTGHASLYWQAPSDIDVTLRAGRYLAGDLGVTVDMSRVFDNGVKMGAFATKTNISAAQFGEGSFDKGIYLDVPFDAFLSRSSNGLAQTLWHPLLRDGGAILGRMFPLAGLTGTQRGLSYKQAGKLLDLDEYSGARKSQFGDVPDSFSEVVPGDSVVTKARKDLSALGHAATKEDFWRGMLLIGGASLGASIFDKSADKLAVRRGAGAAMKRVENVGNFLPVAVAGYSGLMYLTNEEGSRLSSASYSSLAAGGTALLGVTGLKYVVGRARPNQNLGSTKFSLLSKNNGNSSWPSAHTAIMWAAVTPYAKAYDAPWLYGLAAVTNVARVGGRNHWFSDTVGGAMFGYALGDFMWERHKSDKKRGVEWAVSPEGVTAYWKIE